MAPSVHGVIPGVLAWQDGEDSILRVGVVVDGGVGLHLDKYFSKHNNFPLVVPDHPLQLRYILTT